MFDMTPQRPEPAEVLDSMEIGRWRFYGACLVREAMQADASLDPLAAWAGVASRLEEEIKAGYPWCDVEMVLRPDREPEEVTGFSLPQM